MPCSSAGRSRRPGSSPSHSCSRPAWRSSSRAWACGLGTMAAFDIASALFLLLVAPLLRDRADDMRQHAKDNDANRALLLALTAVVSLVVLVSVASEMMGGKNSPLTTALLVATLVLAWLFSNTVYALHYAHMFYSRAGRRGRCGWHRHSRGERARLLGLRLFQLYAGYDLSDIGQPDHLRADSPCRDRPLPRRLRLQSSACWPFRSTCSAADQRSRRTVTGPWPLMSKKCAPSMERR